MPGASENLKVQYLRMAVTRDACISVSARSRDKESLLVANPLPLPTSATVSTQLQRLVEEEEVGSDNDGLRYHASSQGDILAWEDGKQTNVLRRQGRWEWVQVQKRQCDLINSILIMIGFSFATSIRLHCSYFTLRLLTIVNDSCSSPIPNMLHRLNVKVAHDHVVNRHCGIQVNSCSSSYSHVRGFSCGALSRRGAPKSLQRIKRSKDALEDLFSSSSIIRLTGLALSSPRLSSSECLFPSCLMAKMGANLLLARILLP